MPKPKPVLLSDLPPLRPEDEWVRFQGLREPLPQQLQGLPDQKLYHVTVSGSLDAPRSEHKHGVSGEISMAWDVFRHDPKDAPFVFNKDHYFLTKHAEADGDAYLLHGPFRKGEPDHWLREIPEEYADCDVLVSHPVSDERVRAAAYRRWENRGRPIGDDWADWFEAKNALR